MMMFVPLLETAASGLGWLKAAHSALLVCLIPLATLHFQQGRSHYLSKQAVILSYSAFLQH